MPDLVANRIDLRPATINDADILLAWRNDSQTRKASHHSGEVEREEHIRWLTAVLSDPNRQLFVAERDGAPVGTVRADLSEGQQEPSWTELSWTVSPAARGVGVAKEMVAFLASQTPGPVRAEVRVGNFASARIAEHAGLELEKVIDGVQHFVRGPLPGSH